jgi:hypothetical protein
MAISHASQEYKDFIEEIEGRSISKQVVIREKELRGSRIRCIMFTGIPRYRVADFLTDIVKPFSEVHDTIDFWMPRGFKSPDEAELSKNLVSLILNNGRIFWGGGSRDKKVQRHPTGILLVLAQ